MSAASEVSTPGARRSGAAPATFLFTDIEGSTKLARQLGRDLWLATIEAHHRIVGNSIAAHGGRVDRTEGDAFVAIFPDATAALAAAKQAQRDLNDHEWPGTEALRVRMGLHTGSVVRHRTGYLGLDAHLAARVATAANGGQILTTAATVHAARGSVAVRDLGAHRLKDFPEPEHLYHVLVDPSDRGVVVPAPRTASVRPTNLPPQTRALLGREIERAELRALLRAEPGEIVTVAGIGGIGKTRLAVAVGYELLDEFPGGVFLVRLAGVRNPDSILPMIAQAVGVTGQSDLPLSQVLARRLGEQRTLIILDNFEQLTSGSDVLTGLLAHGSELRLLVTSQVPLRVAVERLVPLAPLALEDAVALFIARGLAVRPDFSPTEDERASIENICARLDCMPLAVELAAARLGSLGIADLNIRLEQPLRLLTRGAADAPARQRSLRAAIEWTHALLDADQRSLFARLGVCAGPVPLTTVEAIAASNGSPADTLDSLDQLLEFSFARRHEDRRLGIRFLLPQALRDFAVERLVDVGEENHVRRLHAEHVANLAHAARLWKWGATAEARLGLLAVLDEVRPAVAWARDHDFELHVRICAALSFYWVCAGVLTEVAEEFRRALQTDAGSAADRAWVRTLSAKCAQLMLSGADQAQLTDQAVQAWAAVEDESERALGLGPLSWVLLWDGRMEEALAATREALATFRRSQDRRLILRGLVWIAHALVTAEDMPAAQVVLDEADELAGGDPVWELAAIRGDCAQYREDHVAALRLYAESLSWTSTTGESHQMLMDLRCLVANLAPLGEGEVTLEIAELVRLEEQRTGRVGRMPSLVQWFEQAVATARERVSEAAAQRTADRAREVPPPKRAERAIELVNGVIAAPTVQD